MLMFAAALPVAAVANNNDKALSLPAHWGNANTPLKLDVSTTTEFTIEKPDDIRERIYIQLINVPPAHRSRFKAVVEHKKSVIPPLPSPSQFEQSQLNLESELANVKTKLQAQQQQLKLLDTAPTCIDELKLLIPVLYNEKLASAQVPIVLAEIRNVDVSSGPVTECNDTKKAMEKATKINLEAGLVKGSDLIFSVVYTEGDKTSSIAKIALKEEQKQWLVHAGWTFIVSKDRLYYSQQGEDGSYTIQEQNSQPKTNHALTVMYTYPMWNIGNSAYLGPTGMLGLSQNGLLVGIGGSLGVTENFVINLSLVATEFDRLNGVYAVGQSVGEVPVDSASLNTSKIKPSFALTVGFRF